MLNKKTLRAFIAANSAPTVPSNHGLLHTQQVNHIVRTDIRIIDHRRTLVLYIYDRRQAADSNPAPVWTMFHAGDDYITLARRPDGSTRWREAAFERLGKDYRFKGKCAFYSVRDEQRVCSFFRDQDHGGIAALIHAQDQILYRRQQKRERERDRLVRDRMKCLPALPRNLATWAHRNVMPAYFIYDHAKDGKASGMCTACGQKTALTGVKYNAKGVCPRCSRTLTMKPRGRIGRLYDRETCQVIQRTRTGELVVRIIKACCSYYGEHPGTYVYENARQFFRLDPDGKVRCDSYYYAHGSNKWKQGDRPVMFPYQENFEAETCGHVYCGNLSKALSGTPWEYCPIQLFYEQRHEPMQMYHFLVAHIGHPKLEHLVKVGFHSLVSDLVYRSYSGRPLDESQSRTHRLLGVGAEDVDFLRNLDVNRFALEIFQGYCDKNLKDRQRLLAWQVEQKIERDIDPALEHMSVHKFLRYMDRQYRLLKGRKGQYGGLRYDTAQSVVTEYKDYLEMCEKLRFDMKNSFVLFPKDLQKSHDEVAHRFEIEADDIMRRDFKEAYERVMGQLDFEHDGMRIVYPASPDDIVAEGNALHHCVRNYVDKVAAQKTMILFLRRCENVDKPYFTVEVQNRKVVQVRGNSNAAPTPEVEKFMNLWEQRVLQSHVKAA